MKGYLWAELVSLISDLCLIDETLETGKVNKEKESEVRV